MVVSTPRMGHIAPKAARKLVESGLVVGLALDPSSREEHCEACLKRAQVGSLRRRSESVPKPSSTYIQNFCERAVAAAHSSTVVARTPTAA